jgi:hypothetical protein
MESHKCMAAAPSCYVTRHASRAHNPHACVHILPYRHRLGLNPSHAPLSVKAARHQWPALSRLLCCNTFYCVALVARHEWPALSHCLRLSATGLEGQWCRGSHACHICTGTGGALLPHLHRGTVLSSAHICTGRGRSTDVGPNTVPLQGVLVASSEDTCCVYASPSLEHTPWTHNGQQQPTTSSECHLPRGQRRLRSRAHARQCSAVQCRLRFAARSCRCRCDGGAIW